MLHLLRRIVPLPVFRVYHFFLARLAAFVYHYPSEELIVIGVTGTNGKTTTSYLLAKALEAAGAKVGLTTTAVLKIADKEWVNPTKMTMPGRFFLQRALRNMVKAGCTYAVIETSSQGLIQSRHIGISYDVAVFTNLTPEHLEAHGGFEAYKAAKAILFQHVAKRHPKRLHGQSISRAIVLNAESEHSADYARVGDGVDEVRWYSLDAKKGLTPDEYTLTERGSDLVVQGEYGHVQLPGTYNLQNVLAALATTSLFGIPLGKALDKICEVAYVPGRFEEIALGQPYRVIIDYAYEPEALKQVYAALRLSSRARLIHVLGSCGGGRDTARRAVLGRMAAAEADIVVVTNEDPYDDDPAQIVAEVAAGAKEGGKVEGETLFIVQDRREAIETAISKAQAGDVVLLTGKGNEPWICVEHGKKISWSERGTAEAAIRRFHV